ncbi:MAG: alpha/beta hydrolase [Bacteroidota bacterium]|nr:alpha/beta hydrolase [Bacteroidota bacterium]MDE2956521.1 alpha/beta hydrolase [Bacteroidota bacterium]
MPLHLKKSLGYEFIDAGEPTDKPAIVLLHGLLGDPEGWYPIVAALKPQYRVLVPRLPIDSMPMDEANVQALQEYVSRFLADLSIEKVVAIGNSLGGQLALLHALAKPDAVAGMVLLGSSGLEEIELGKRAFKRRSRSFIRKHAAKTFFDPIHVTHELVERVFSITSNRSSAVRYIRISRSARDLNLSRQLKDIHAPTALIWGTADQITPLDVAYEFHARLPVCELHFIEECGHAPMIESPKIVSQLVLDFMQRIVSEPSPSTIAA